MRITHSSSDLIVCGGVVNITHSSSELTVCGGGVRTTHSSSELIVCAGGMRSILLFPLEARCIVTMDIYVYGACLFYVCCSDCVGVCGNDLSSSAISSFDFTVFNAHSERAIS